MSKRQTNKSLFDSSVSEACFMNGPYAISVLIFKAKPPTSKTKRHQQLGQFLTKPY